ncbi:MAG: hypothetical protein KJ755_00375 [Alphaproteobacteria bacterium]|nr:hypothetical protein [Alphaproteobacteria bacterium]
MHTTFPDIHSLWTPQARHPYHVARDEDERVLSGPSAVVSISGVTANEGTHAIRNGRYGILTSKASSPLKAESAVRATGA